jgi:hypothetical protein
MKMNYVRHDQTRLRGMSEWFLSRPGALFPKDAITGAFPVLVTPERCQVSIFRTYGVTSGEAEALRALFASGKISSSVRHGIHRNCFRTVVNKSLHKIVLGKYG